MKTNKERSHEIIAEKIRNNTLVISKSQLVVPLSCFNEYLYTLEWVKLALQARAYYNAKHDMPKIATKSIKASLNEYNMGNIIERYDLNDDKLYVNVSDAERMSGMEFEYFELFDTYTANRNYSDSFEEFKYYANKFFKYMKQFQSLIPEYMDTSYAASSWCCEDCDGPFEGVLNFSIQMEKSKITNKLAKFTYITK